MITAEMWSLMFNAIILFCAAGLGLGIFYLWVKIDTLSNPPKIGQKIQARFFLFKYPRDPITFLPETMREGDSPTYNPAGRPREDEMSLKAKEEYGFNDSDIFMQFLKEANTARSLDDGSFKSLCKNRARPIPPSTVRSWIKRYLED